MSEQDNLNVVRQGYEAFGQGDIPKLLSLFDGQIEWVTPVPPELPTSGRRKGLQEVGEFFTAVSELFDIQRFEAKELIAQGDRVIVLGDETAAREGNRRGPRQLLGALDHLESGKVVAFQEYIDTAATVAELQAAKAAVAAKP